MRRIAWRMAAGLAALPLLVPAVARAQDSRAGSGDRDDGNAANDSPPGGTAAPGQAPRDRSDPTDPDVAIYADRYDRGIEDVERALRLSGEANPEYSVPQRGGEVSKIVDYTVRGRFRPRFQQEAILVGGFRVFPRVGVTTGYDANVFRTSDRKDDAYVVPAATLRANSTWGRHGLSFAGSVSDRQYATYTTENGTQYSAALNGRLDVVGRSTITAHLEQARIIRDRGAVGELPNSLRPIRFDQTLAGVTGFISTGRFGFVLSGDTERRNFQDAQALSGAPLDQSYRDLRRFIATGEGRYYFNPQVSAFASVSYDQRRFRQVVGFGNRDVNTTQYLVGLRGDITPLIYGHIGAGLLHQDFEQAGVDNKLGLALDADLNWLVTELTTIRFTADRSVRNAGLRDVSNFTALTFSLRADHELLRNVLLNVQVEHQTASYVNSTRVDHLPGAQAGAEWLINRKLRSALQLTAQRRTSNFATRPNFFNFGATLGLTYAF